MDKGGLRFPPGLKEDGPGGYVERENMTQHSIPIPQVSAIILTFNEERHIVRCIRNIGRVAREIFVVDSFSSDRTCELAEAEERMSFSIHISTRRSSSSGRWRIFPVRESG